jgi:hypothetical protein
MPAPQPDVLPSLRVLVNRVLAANALIERAISRLADSADGDLTELISAVDQLTALAMEHAPTPEQPKITRRQRAQAARDLTAQAAADAEADLFSYGIVDPNIVSGSGSIGVVIVTVV